MKHKLTLSILFIALLVIPAAMTANAINYNHEPVHSTAQPTHAVVDPTTSHSQITDGNGGPTPQDCVWVYSGGTWEYICQ